MYLTDASRSMKYVNGWLHEPYYLTTCVPDGGLLCQQQMQCLQPKGIKMTCGSRCKCARTHRAGRRRMLQAGTAH